MSRESNAAVKVATETTEVKPITPSRPEMGKRFRQKRHHNELVNLTMLVHETTCQVRNWSRTGIGFETEKRYKVGDILENVRLSYSGIELYNGAIEVKNVLSFDSSRNYYGAAFHRQLFSIEGVDSAVSVSKCAGEVFQLKRTFEEINPDFCRSVLALSASLRHIRRACEKEQERWRNLTFDQRCESERLFMPEIVHRLKEVFFNFNREIDKQVDVETLPDDSIYHQVFHEEIYPYFEGADLVRRAYEKPRGYAGDYEMMNQIYRNGFEGLDLFGRILHHYIANENSGESVKYRKPYFFDHITGMLRKSAFSRVLTIASGPAIEIQEVFRKWEQKDLDRVEFTLLDLDREALEHAQAKIFEIAHEEGKIGNCNFVNASIKAFMGAGAVVEGTFDLIYSGGLFDYLDNTTSAVLVNRLFSLLNPKGVLIIGNFTKDNLTKAFLHLLTKWALIHKTEDEMKAWADGIENCTVDVEYDPLKMNAFLVIRKNAG